MTIDTKNLRALAEATTANHANTYKCVLAEQAFYSAASPATVIQLLDALERKDAAIKKCYSEVIRGLADVVNVHTPDKLFDLDAIPRDPVMAIVSRIKTSMEAITKEIGA